MAATVITNSLIKNRNELFDFTATVAISATDGCLIDWHSHDDRMVVVLENSSSSAACAVTVVKGEGSALGVKDLSLSIPASGKKLLMLDSAKYKNMEGTNAGTVLIKGATLKVGVIKLAF